MPGIAGAMGGFSWELGVLALGVAVLVAALAAAVRAFVLPPREGPVVPAAPSAPDSIRLGAGEATKTGALLSRLAGPLIELVRPSGSNEISQLQLRLIQGGRRSEHAIEAFLASKVAFAVGATLAFLELNGRRESSLGLPLVALLALLACAAGFFVPNLWLSSLTNRRKLTLRRELPNAMDLLVTCVEAGQGLDQALLRVATELKAVAPLLASELNTTFFEAQAGLSRRESFRRLAERTGVDDLRQLAAVLTQTEIFGTSIARALRIQAEGMRTVRMQHAERSAGMVSVKMTFPLVLCILPTVVGVVMGPAIVRMAEHFMHTGP
jgi:tight adherence protein C